MDVIRKSLALLIVILAALSAYAATWTTIDPPGSTWTFAYGVNNAGDVVGYYADTDGATHGFLFHNGSYTTIDPPNSIFTIAQGINDSGQIVGSYSVKNGKELGFVFDGTNYTFLDYPDSFANYGFGINNAGTVVGSYDDQFFNKHGYTWSNGTFTSFDVPKSNGEYTQAFGIDNHGRIVGYTQILSEPYIFVRSPQGTYRLLKPFGGVAQAWGINDHYRIVGRYNEGFKFNLTTKKLQTFRFPGADRHTTIGFGINNLSQIVGSYSASDVWHGFLRTPK